MATDPKEFGVQRFRKGALELPPNMETAIGVYGANLALYESKPGCGPMGLAYCTLRRRGSCSCDDVDLIHRDCAE